MYIGSYNENVIQIRDIVVEKLELNKKKPIIEGGFQPSARAFKKLAEDWYESIKLNVKESTYAAYYVKIYNHIIPGLGNYSEDDINVNVIRSFINNLLGTGFSQKTVADTFTVVKSIIKYGKLACDLKEIKIRKDKKERNY